MCTVYSFVTIATTWSAEEEVKRLEAAVACLRHEGTSPQYRLFKCYVIERSQGFLDYAANTTYLYISEISNTSL